MLPDKAHETGFGRLLHGLCDLCAGVGGLVLVGMALLTVVSVIGRAFFSSPILGDVELVQLGTAVCVALFLPYTQMRGGNIIVDFFTQRASARTQRVLDGFGTLFYSVVMALVAWRVCVGGLQSMSYEESSMLLGFPIWIAYLAMVPGLVLCALIGLHHTVWHWFGGRARREAELAARGVDTTALAGDSAVVTQLDAVAQAASDSPTPAGPARPGPGGPSR